MDERCETCKHWTRLWDDGDPWGACDQVDETNSKPDALITALVFGTDRYDAEVQVRSTFGCVLHEPRDTQESPHP